MHPARAQLLIVAATLAPVSSTRAVAGELDPASAKCQKCHALADWWVRDQVTRRRMLLTIETSRYEQAAHGDTPCSSCHETGYDEIPHRGAGHKPTFLCVVCHAGDANVEALDLETRKSHLLESIHGRKSEHEIDCHSCHDPHYFRLVRGLGDALHRIDGSNEICLDCHGPQRDQELYPDLRDVLTLHDRFPNPTAHFRKVKCVGCHTGVDSTTRHDVVGKDDALRECTACHSRDSAVLKRVYDGKAKRHAQQNLAAPIEEDDVEDHAYVIGSTRSPVLDRLSLAGFLVTVLGISIHALARVIHSRASKGK